MAASSDEGSRPAYGQVLVPLGTRSAPLYRLVCVPYAGGGSGAYRQWPSDLPDWVEVVAVRLPGREALIGMSPLNRIDPVIDLLSGAMLQIQADGMPFGIFGHSMGALVCYALAVRLQQEGRQQPSHLFVAGRRGPHLPDQLPAIHRLPRPEFIDRVLALGGIPQEIVQIPGLLDLVVPALRADFAICETFTYCERPPLRCALSAFGGYDDPTTTRDQLDGWRPHTSGSFRLRMYSGGHFFIGPHRAEMLQAIVSDLRTPVPGAVMQARR